DTPRRSAGRREGEAGGGYSMRTAALLLFLTWAASAQLTYERLVNAAKEPQSWLTYWGDYSGVRHRELDQINVSNVANMRVEWIYQTGIRGAFETVPLVVDGVMYITAGDGLAMALDPKSGRELWRYKYSLDPEMRLCCGTVNRGLAMLGDRLFMATPDAHVVALDARDGKLLWDAEMGDYRAGYGATVAPMVVKDKVIVGVSGGEFGIRGFVDAYDAATGKRAWRFHTVAARGEPGGDTWLADSWKRGGGATWLTGTYDPQLNLVYWPVGNPGPDLYGKDRLGDNLFTNCMVALDADPGKLRWYFQFTPHDTHDWDANETPMLLDLEWKGKQRKLLLHANRNGFFYVLDRVTGEFLSGIPFSRQTWAKGLDAKGRPIPNDNIEPTPEGNRQCPGLAGATNWMAPSWNPQTRLFYLQLREQCDVYFSSPPTYIEGKPYWGSVFRGVTDEKESGALLAIDPITGKQHWSFRYNKAPWAGTMSTSGGLIFAGDEDGYFMAFDARTGKLLYKLNTGNRLVTSPVTYMVEGRQYVTMPSGSALLTFSLPRQ
ncbi:MAG TPA: PQQ-dependent dehydrogenase, methanol/ethanol family, partial [Bryobacteraceae bacterium]|nr:PQQ-dependent dehydrogenase, methanol/ethanol family [Bryobacteraceae bacterium]